MALSEADDSFYYVDQILASNIYRIFLYRLASYSQWLLPDALESRGITFQIDDDHNPVELVSRPLLKFFNNCENPFTMDLDFSTAFAVQDKMDGSLISTVRADDGVWLKSKGSLFSDQAMAANALIHTKEYVPLSEFLNVMVNGDYTVCMEYTGPTNRIVIGYMESRLTVLAVRCNVTGDYYPLEGFEKNYPDASKFFVKNHINDIDDVTSFVNDINGMEKVEGYVIWLDGITIKIKTEWYMVLHHLKDSINSQRRLYEAVVYETIDDVRAQFYDDPVALQIIEDMEERVRPIYNNMVTLVEGFYEANKDLERKEYAIKGQVECGKLYFGLAMSKYLGKEIDYKAHMVKHRKDYGIKDDPVGVPVEMPES
jgi:T4 RnlA family RNA ligase